MEHAARQYARRILLLHVIMLVIVLLGVGLSVRLTYQSARTQAIEQASGTLSLLGRQTAAGVQSYYRNAFNVLDLLRPIGEDMPMRPREPAPGRPGPRALGGNGGPTTRPQELHDEREEMLRLLRDERQRLASAVFGTVRGRVSQIIVVDRDDGSIIDSIAETDAPDPNAVIEPIRDWLVQQRRPEVSRFGVFDERAGHLLVVPFPGPVRRSIVVFVPIRGVETAMLGELNRHRVSETWLVDDRGVVMSAPRPELIGKNVRTDLSDPRMREMAARYMETGVGATQVFDRDVRLGETSLGASLSTIQPVQLTDGKVWWIVISQSLDRVDEMVNPIFRQAITWAAVVMLAVTVVLVSTATQMIRGRARMERMRSELIDRELQQARQIQLQWLPGPFEGKQRVIDIAAVNQPASHISGDFYNWFELEDGRTCVVIGDVTGHGMSAAFLMSSTQLLVRTSMNRCADVGQCLTEVNRQLCTQIFHGQFVTMAAMIIDIEAGQLEIVSAGHPAPLVSQDDGFIELAI
ncbi:MAG TPA: SpoIIE family protein phosphatase, partial [Tepidisphaeraceae bacterium]|nr:SpoIIE family protein phosphatase [Tepidisphaeraceae bacterium]